MPQQRLSFRDDASSQDEGSSTPSLSGRANRDAENEVKLAARETSAVKGLRIVMLLVLLCSMIGFAAGIFVSTKEGEKDDFETQFHENAHKVLQAIGSSFFQSLGSIDSFVMNAVAAAHSTNQTWPFVTIPYFAERADKTLTLSKGIQMVIYTFIDSDQREAWETFAAIRGPEWLEHSVAEQKGLKKYAHLPLDNFTTLEEIHDNDGPLPKNASGPFAPIWQTHPVAASDFPVWNWDLYSWPNTRTTEAVKKTHQVAMTETYLIADENDTELIAANEITAEFFSDFITTGEEAMEPIVEINYPVVEDALSAENNRDDSFDASSYQTWAMCAVAIYWRDWLKGILPEGDNGIVVVVESPCNPTFTYQINGPHVQFLGTGDKHEPKYKHLEQSAFLHDLGEYAIQDRAYPGLPLNQEICPYYIRVLPSSEMEDDYTTSSPLVNASIAIAIFLATSLAFLLYDWCVERRQMVVMSTAVRSEAIVSSLFPSMVRDRLYTPDKEQNGKSKMKEPFLNFMGTHTDVNTNDNPEGEQSLPIADLFPETTVFFADIKGFTSWSSAREPVQVFVLLEALYSAFDKIAKKRGVFKVETIGDSYVAVTGLPNAMKNHAVVMAKFAADCRNEMNMITKQLETALGTGTADLSLRLGIHSGPVTAGVIRGEKSRFQLFGDTVNTAARMESTGVAGRIQASATTAELLRAAGKGAWVVPREELVNAKGKGTMQTYWVDPENDPGPGMSADMATVTLMSSSGENGGIFDVHGAGAGAETARLSDSKMDLLIAWNVDMLKDLVCRVMVINQATDVQWNIDYASVHSSGASGGSPCDEIEDLIPPHFQPKCKDAGKCGAAVLLPGKAQEQLQSLVATIAHSYRPLPFHCFDHASQVASSTRKLLQQIAVNKKSFAPVLGDPLVQFALLFAALVHDADHPGVSNTQLIQERAPIAVRYNGKSVAEQNSIDIAWKLFLDPSYADLHKCLFTSAGDLTYFRQHLVNAVIATDIFDPDLKVMQDKRWESAFSEVTGENSDNAVLGGKTAAMAAQIIKVSDVSHCMQHWTIYQHWNLCLFEEMYAAYKDGRGDRNPAEGWYDGELWFFDNVVLPLAKRFKDCEAFGELGQEYLDNAIENRREWEKKGRAIVVEMEETCRGGEDGPGQQLLFGQGAALGHEYSSSQSSSVAAGSACRSMPSSLETWV